MTYKKVNDIIMRNIIDPEYKEYSGILIKMKCTRNLQQILQALEGGSQQRGLHLLTSG